VEGRRGEGAEDEGEEDGYGAEHSVERMTTEMNRYCGVRRVAAALKAF
jgi:hypothetical protein